ncbi:MAG TPA: hypothetical protein VMH91_02060 [Candidatus Paceibacterota bacterium]|nr:hypothetical protein [Candidatus Paceibacterota bacterium]
MTTQLTTTTQVPATALTLTDVFSYPEYSLRGIKSWEEVAKLGSKNLAALVSRAREHEQSLSGSIARLKEQQNLLRGKSGEDFKEMAKAYENPTITQIGVPSDSWSKDPEPLDADSKNRKSDATTFNKCGWCKHTGGGTCRYNYHITTRCSLLGDASPETRFNTPCLLQEQSAEGIAKQVERLQREIDDTLAKREKVREGIKLLQKLKKGAPEKPYLISLRPHDMFNVGDDAMVYIGQWGDRNEHKKVADGKWVPVTVVFGYRHHDGCVSAQALFPIHSNVAFDGGCGYGAGMSRPEILLRSEFEWLRHASEEGDLGFLGLWIANIDTHLEGIDRVQFLKDLTGEIALPPADWAPPTDEIQVKSVKDAQRVLHCLDPDLFETEEEIRSYANMQLRYVHPDRLNGKSDNVKSYAARQTRAVYAARDLLIERLKSRKK